ncbi:hypothetical protein [uncultured Aquimarina sp.]|uniref:hypothetical protein n=1 Tax=uncultured Aquimarina sp. TaxID=575652 RepID=UPI0026210C7D|nr:hypothetical protein [uncultured Aquimarina sp.]
MSILVYPYRRNKRTNEIEGLSASCISPYNDMFGPENWRVRVWGTKLLEKLNCFLIYSLLDSNLYVEKTELIALKEELNILLQHSQTISNELKVNEDTFKFRVYNALEAIRIALLYDNSGVAIE